MKIKYFDKDDILVLNLSNKPVDYAEESNWVVVNFDSQRQPVSIEILDASRFLAEQGRVLPDNIKQKYFLPLTA